MFCEKRQKKRKDSDSIYHERLTESHTWLIQWRRQWPCISFRLFSSAFQNIAYISKMFLY